MQEYAVNYFIKGDSKNTYHPHVKDEHFLQAQVYKYLAERSTPPESLLKRGVSSVKLVESNIQAFSMGQFPRTGGTYRWKDHWKKPETDWEIPAIPLKDDAWIEAYIKKSAWPIYRSLILNEDRPAICPPENNSKGQHSWRCTFCAFHQSKYCPNPTMEWDALNSGTDTDAAFQKAKESLV